MSDSGWSLNTFDEFTKRWVIANVPPDTEILDVGAGAGKYSWLLRRTHPKLDALEIWPKNILEYDLFAKYRTVHIGDIREFDTSAYGFLIMGDLLEHLSVEDAQAVLARAKCPVLLQVPFEYPQGPLSGNEAERHLQPDLTPETMKQRYPCLRELAADPKLGVYLKDAN